MEATSLCRCSTGKHIIFHSSTHLPRIVGFLRYHDPEASLEEGLAVLRRCIDEVTKRLVVAQPKYKVKVVDKDGVREVEF